MISMENTLYSNVLATSMNTFIIEGVCVKDREGDKNISLSEVLRRISNFENIGVQSGNIVSIYCTEDKARALKHNLYMDNGYQYKQSIREAIQNGIVNIYTPIASNIKDIIEYKTVKIKDLLKVLYNAGFDDKLTIYDSNFNWELSTRGNEVYSGKVSQVSKAIYEMTIETAWSEVGELVIYVK